MTELVCDGKENCKLCDGVGKLYDSTLIYPMPCPECKPYEVGCADEKQRV